MIVRIVHVTPGYWPAWEASRSTHGDCQKDSPPAGRSGVDGLLVNPQDPRHIGEALVRLLKDPAERARLGGAGYTRTTSEFTWDKVIDRVEGLYKELASPERLPVSANAGRASI